MSASEQARLTIRLLTVARRVWDRRGHQGLDQWLTRRIAQARKQKPRRKARRG
jgi:hypothetical protein